MTRGAGRRTAAVGALLLLAAVVLHPAGRLSNTGNQGGTNVLATVFAAVCGALGAGCVVVALRSLRTLRAMPPSGLPGRPPNKSLARLIGFTLCAALLMTPAGSQLLQRLQHHGGRASAAALPTARAHPGSGSKHARSAPPLPQAAALGAALVALAMLGAAALRRRRGGSTTPAVDSEEDSLDRALDAAAAALDGPTPEGADPRERVIRCYAAMEHVLAATGTPRRPADTPAELLGRAERAGRIPAEPAAALTDLFRRARYGRAPLEAGDVTAARDALRTLRDATATEIVT